MDGLLILRIVATLAVVTGHSASFFGGLAWTQHPPGPYLQSQAVTLFFFVSGFTIAWVCNNDLERGTSIFKYLYDRATRLLVPLVPILMLQAAIELVLLDPHPYAQNFNLSTGLANIAFLQGIELGLPLCGTLITWGYDAFGTNRPLWTISVEFWIYVAYGGFIFAAFGQGRLCLLAAWMAGILGLMAINNYIVGGRGSSLALIWLIGAICYYAFRNLPMPSSRAMLAFAPAIIFIVVQLLWRPSWPVDGTYTLLYNLLIVAAAICFIAFCPSIPAGWGKWIQDHEFAYTTYLAHYPIQYWIWSADLLPSGTGSALAAAAVSVVASWGLWWCFERHYKRVRKTGLVIVGKIRRLSL